MDRFKIRQYNGEKVINIRKIQVSEAPIFSAMSDSVNWNVTAAECEYMTRGSNTNAFFLEADGEIAGSAGMVEYGDDLVFINLVIVKPEFRRRGYATMLLEHIINSKPNCRTFKLHATPEGSKVYAPLGFKPRSELSFYSGGDWSFDRDYRKAVRQASAGDLAMMSSRDKKCFGYDRSNVLEFNLSVNPELALVSADGKGFILGRRGKRFRQLCNLIADDLETAQSLIQQTAELDRSLPLSMVAYEKQQDFQKFLQACKFEKTRVMIDMELGEATPDVPDDYYVIYGGDMG